MGKKEGTGGGELPAKVKYLFWDGTTSSLAALQDGLGVERALTDCWSSLPSVLVEAVYPAWHRNKKRIEDIMKNIHVHRSKNIQGLKQNGRKNQK